MRLDGSSRNHALRIAIVVLGSVYSAVSEVEGKKGKERVGRRQRYI